MKTKKYEDFKAHGEKLQDFIADKGSKYQKVELWIKFLSYVLYWYFKHPNQTFFVSHKTTIKYFKACGCDCTLRGIQEAVRICKELDLIKVTYADTKKTESVNPDKWIYRKITLNWRNIYKNFSVYDKDSKTYKELKAKSRLKKLINKRPCSYVKMNSLIFQKAKEELGDRKYQNEMQMFTGFVYTISSKYYNITKYNHRPAHLINIQEKADAEILRLINSLPPDIIEGSIGKLEGLEAPKIDPEFQDFMKKIGLKR